MTTTEQFQQVLSMGILTESQLRALQALYAFPRHSATSQQLAAILEYKNFGGTNAVIGNAAKAIANALDITPEFIKPDGQPAWFTVITEGVATERGLLWVMRPEFVEALERTNLISSELGPYFLPDEEQVNMPDEVEGGRIQIEVNIFERSKKARLRCIDYYGAKCIVCSFDFESTFGPIGKGFIHVHHIVPLSEIGQSYIIDYIRDLRPVCPNCHAMIHAKKPPYTIDEIINIRRHTGPL